jgi:hypothetical protein
MDYRAVTTLALRLTGIAVLVKVLPYASTNFIGLMNAGAQTPRQALWMTSLALVILVLVGLALIWFPARLSSLVVGSAPAVDAGETSDRLGEIALLVVGVYLFATGVLDLVYYVSKLWLFEAWVRKREYAEDVSIPSYDFAGLITGVARLLIGAILAFKSRTLYGWILRVRDTRPK